VNCDICFIKLKNRQAQVSVLVYCSLLFLHTHYTKMLYQAYRACTFIFTKDTITIYSCGIFLIFIVE